MSASGAKKEGSDREAMRRKGLEGSVEKAIASPQERIRDN
jgi:hypothetical protein